MVPTAVIMIVSLDCDGTLKRKVIVLSECDVGGAALIVMQILECAYEWRSLLLHVFVRSTRLLVVD